MFNQGTHENNGDKTSENGRTVIKFDSGEGLMKTTALKWTGESHEVRKERGKGRLAKFRTVPS